MSVLAWVDEPIPSDGLSDDARALRSALRDELTRLSAQQGEALHATFTGLRCGADVESLLFYNVDPGSRVFRAATAYGLRFELGGGRMPAPPSGRTWRCCYEYRLAPVGRSVKWWRSAYSLAQFDGAALPASRGFPTATDVWYAVRRGHGAAWERLRNPADRFRIDLRLSVPGDDALTPDLLKPLLDGVTAAFQSHGDDATAAAAADVLAASLGADQDEVAELLFGDDRAVLGGVDQLPLAHRHGITWNTRDDRCVAATVEVEHRASAYVLSGVLSPAEASEDTDDHVARNPLCWRRSPIPWERYGVVSDRPALQIVYTTVPGAAIAEVNVVEHARSVTIELVERELAGTMPDGAGIGRTLVPVSGCLEIPLTAPLADRSVIDATANVRRPAITDSRDPDSPDRAALTLLARGCPRWDR